MHQLNLKIVTFSQQLCLPTFMKWRYKAMINQYLSLFILKLID